MANAFLGIQFAADVPRGHDLRLRLADAVRDLRGCASVAAQRAVWVRAAASLAQAVANARYGTWDLIRDKADGAYEEWASGLEAMAGWPAGDFGSGGELLLVSVIVLATGESNADRTLGELCDLPERDWQRRSTYRRLVGAPPLLNLTNLLGSGLYLAPHPDQPGFSEAVLTGEGFEYLAEVRD